MRRRSLIASRLAMAVSLAAGLAACGSNSRSNAGSSNGSNGGSTQNSSPLVVDTAFNLTTADPGHMFAFTGQIIDRAVYSTLLTYEHNTLKLVPQLAARYTVSHGGDVYTFHLDPKAVFADGRPVTSADVLFSYRRLQNLQGDPSFLLADIKVSAPNTHTVVLRTAKPNAAIPEIVTNPSLGVLEASIVKAHGGTDAADAAKTDHAQAWLNDHSAGSGPYEIAAWNVNGPVRLTANAKYWQTPPTYKTVVIQDAQPEQQKLDVQAGSAQLGLDLSPDQAKNVGSARVSKLASTFVVYTSLNTDPKVSSTTSNPKIVQAVKDAIDYPGLVNLAGSGAAPAPSLIPTGFAGSLPAADRPTTDVAAAKRLVAESGVKDPSITISFANDNPVNGLQLGDVAALIQSDLQAVGIKVSLLGQPVTTSTQLRQSGKAQMIVNYWGPDYPDANDYLPFAPGGDIAEQVHWSAADDRSLAALAQRAATAPTQARHSALWRQVERRSNAEGPIIPLLQPAQVLLSSDSITTADSNPAWRIDLASVR